jgi:hypothetical protein
MHRAIESALRHKRISVAEAAGIRRFYERGLEGSTYLD